MKEPNFLVQTEDKKLHAYWDLTILLIDLWNYRDQKVQVYRLEDGLRTRYAPVTEEELRRGAA